MAFIKKIQTKTVNAKGEISLRLLALWITPLAWFSTISVRISTAAWNRPGTPEVALRAADHRKKQPKTPNTSEKKTESRLNRLKSTMLVCLTPSNEKFICRCCK